MAELKAQEIFASGTWNGLQFDERALEDIVSSFEALGLSGRVPLKFGHDSAKPMKDGQPALGWVSKVWREGRKLLADFANVPDKVMQLIKDKAYKHVSVELVRNIKAGTREIPWTLDAVALLGADAPAVGILKELSAHTASATLHLRGGERFAFTRSYGGSSDMTEINELRATVAKQHQQLLQQQIERDIEAGACLPAARHGFSLVYRLTDEPESYSRVTLGDWQQFRQTQPRGMSARDGRPTSMARLDDEQLLRVADPGARVVELIEKHCDAKGLDITNPLHRDAATRAVFKANPQLAHDYLNMAGRI